MTYQEKKLCVICAWRENCQKKFKIGEGKINCPDFCEDLKLKQTNTKKNEKTTTNNN